jgi:hypothetical protein
MLSELRDVNAFAVKLSFTVATSSTTRAHCISPVDCVGGRDERKRKSNDADASRIGEVR